jgi:hypothetical protein
MARRLLSTARHEAAHAVVASYVGIPVTRAWIDPSGDGWVSYDLRFRHPPLTRAVVCMAGTAADHLWNRLPLKLVSAGDAVFIRDTLKFYGSDWGHLEHLARGLLLKHESAVQALAFALQRQDLTGCEVRELIREFGEHPLKGRR